MAASIGLGPVDGACPMTSSGCGPTSRRSGGRRPRAATSASRSPSPSASSPTGSASRRRPAASSVEADDTGNLVAWWRAGSGPGVLTGSHLDSVLDGGAYDGPLGVVSALAAVDELRVAGRRAGAADRGVGVRRGGGVAVRAGLPGLAARDRRDRRGTGARALRDRDGVALRGGRRGRRSRAAGRRRDVRGAARRAGPRPGRPGRRDRGGQRDLAARALPLRLRRRGQPRRARRGWRTGPTRCSPTR